MFSQVFYLSLPSLSFFLFPSNTCTHSFSLAPPTISLFLPPSLPPSLSLPPYLPPSLSFLLPFLLPFSLRGCSFQRQRHPSSQSQSHPGSVCGSNVTRATGYLYRGGPGVVYIYCNGIVRLNHRCKLALSPGSTQLLNVARDANLVDFF